MAFGTFIELHRFFCRKSQHYVLGDWLCYTKGREKWAYIAGFPRAYVRFMWYSLVSR